MRATIVTGIAIGSAGSWGAAIAHASTHQETATYSCSEPGMGSESSNETFVFSSAAPDSVTVGQPTPPVQFTVTNQVPTATVEAMRTYYGVDSLSSNGKGSVTVTAPHEDIHLTVPFTVPRTKLPASGSLTIVATGTFPSVTPTWPGVAKITMGGFTENNTSLDANGNPMTFGTDSETCTPESSQGVLIQSIRINPAPQITHPPVPNTPTAVPTRTHSRGHGSPSPSSSSANSGHVTRPPSSATTPAPAPTTHLPAGINGEDMAIIAAAAVGCAAIGGLAAWLAARIRQHRRR